MNNPRSTIRQALTAATLYGASTPLPKLWPTITTRKDAPPNADEQNGVKGKRDLLAE